MPFEVSRWLVPKVDALVPTVEGSAWARGMGMWMGETTARYFRDKLAMRVRARNQGVLVPDFVHVVNDEAIRRFADRVQPGLFVRVHRRWLVRRSAIAELSTRRIGRTEIVLRNGLRLPAGRVHLKNVRQIIQGSAKL